MISKLERRAAEVLGPVVAEVAAAVHSAGVIHADETSWRQERRKTWLWVAVTAMSTVFTIARNRSAKVARAVLGTHDEAIAVTDRCGSYDWIAGTHRQVCWSHTIRTQSTNRPLALGLLGSVPSRSARSRGSVGVGL
jgi:hypothetical protein